MYQIPEESLISLCALLARETKGNILKLENGCIGWDSPCSAWYSRYNFNGVKRAQCQAAVNEIKEKHTPGKPIFIFYTQELRTEDFDDRLEALGLHCMSEQLGMLYDMDKGTIHMSRDEAIEIISADELYTWSEVNAAAFGKPNEPEAFAALEKSGECDFYAYKEEGRIVATAMFHRDDSNAGIHEVSTRLEYRGRGIGGRMISRIISDAQAAGIPRITLQASQMGASVYEKLGFKPISHIKTWIYNGGL